MVAHKPSLLIVDDEPGVLLTLRLVFEDSGYLVTTAESGARALQLIAHQGNFDGVLTDLSMERPQSGLEVARAAARLRPRPAIVVFTGFGTIENVKAAVGTAVDHFALKPIDLDAFKSVLGRLLALRNDRLILTKSAQR